MSRRSVTVPLVAGGAGFALGAVEVAVEPGRALVAYASAVAFALTIALGSLAFLMITHTTRARWFVVFRRVTSAIAGTLPLFLILFVPIAAGVSRLYPWAGNGEGLDPEQRAWVGHVHPWLNTPFFVLRSYAYLGVWSALALTLRGAGLEGDVRPGEALVRRERTISAAGLPILAVTLTMAAFDWVMSLSPRWASDMMGVYLFAGALSGSIGVTAVGCAAAWRAGALPRAVGPAHFHALGRLLFMSVILWAYIGFAQFLLIWIADMQRESSFFIDRVHGGWQWASAALVVFHFVVPFLYLLSRSQKRIPVRLAVAGGGLVCVHALDVYWLMLPSHHAGMHLLDLGFLVGVGGLCTAFGVFGFFGAAPFPLHDPALTESLRYESP